MKMEVMEEILDDELSYNAVLKFVIIFTGGVVLIFIIVCLCICYSMKKNASGLFEPPRFNDPYNDESSEPEEESIRYDENSFQPPDPRSLQAVDPELAALRERHARSRSPFHRSLQAVDPELVALRKRRAIRGRRF